MQQRGRKGRVRALYNAVQRLRPGQAIEDPEIRGLRYRCVGSAAYGQYRFKSPLTGKQDAISLGRVASLEELEAIALARLEEQDPDPETEMASTSLVPDYHAFEPFRAKARKLRARVLAGQDPKSQTGPEGFTLQQGLELLVQKATKAGKSERTIQEYELNVRRYFADWREVPLRRFDGQPGRTAVRRRHEKIAKRAPMAANSAMGSLRRIWNLVRKEDVSLGESPTAAVHWVKPKPKDHAIPIGDDGDERQLRRWFAELAAMSNETKRDWFLLAALLGLRRTSLSSIKHVDIDLHRAILHVPKPKGGVDRAFTVPLSNAAMAVVKRRLAASGGTPWLFPANSKSGHIEEVRPEAEDCFSVRFSPHDLRRLYISAATATGVHPDHKRLLAGHQLPRSDAHNVYTKLGPEALRPSQQAITDYFKQHGLILEGS
jgi:integrase